MALWPALPGGLPECVTGVFDLLEERMDDFRTNAKNMFGCRGILPPLYMSPECGLKKNPQAHVQYWTGSAAWLAQVYFDYWSHTGDRDFLVNRAIPFLREAAAFYEDFLVEGADGLLHNYPGNSPENAPQGHLDAKGEPARVCVDATMDVALMRELFSNLVAALRIVDGDSSPDLPRFEAVLNKLPAYRVNEDGAIAEWIDARQKDNYHHRHLSHLYPLFPGFEIHAESGPLFDACRVAVEKRLVVGLADQTGWSLAHMAHVYSRLGKPGRALQSLQLMCRSIVGVNLFTAHNDLRDMGITMDYRKGPRPVVQTEANNGVTSAVYEMLALSTPDNLRLLPALPFSWKSGNLTGLRLRGGGQLDIHWDRNANWWRASFSGPLRRVTLGKITQANAAPELGNPDADGFFHIDGCFCESGEAILK
jgi:alpha-L-fucosidase 2